MATHPPEDSNRDNTTSANPQCHLFISAFRQLSTFQHNIITLLYILPNMIRVTKSRKIKWARHVVRMERGEVHATGGKETIWKNEPYMGGY